MTVVRTASSSALGELLDVAEALRRLGTRRCVLATLVETEGSSYRKPGAMALVTPEGMVHGLLSGGCLEGDVAAHAEGVAARGAPRLLTYDLRGEAGGELGLGNRCPGVLRILLEPVALGTEGDPFRVWRDEGAEAHCQALVFEGEGTLRGLVGRRLWYPAQTTDLPFPPSVRRTLRRQLATLPAGGGRVARIAEAGGFLRAFLWRPAPRVRLAVFGGGPDVSPVLELSRTLGWNATRWDFRERPGERPSTCFAWSSLADQLRSSRPHAVLVMTHHFEYDVRVLEAVAEAGAPPYLGVLGSRRRAEALRDRLTREGMRLPGLRSPMGLSLGGESPPEIALSIVAEVQKVLSSRLGEAEVARVA